MEVAIAERKISGEWVKMIYFFLAAPEAQPCIPFKIKFVMGEYAQSGYGNCVCAISVWTHSTFG